MSRTPARALQGCRFRAKRQHLERFYDFLPENQGQILALTVLYVPCSLDGGNSSLGQLVSVGDQYLRDLPSPTHQVLHRTPRRATAESRRVETVRKDEWHTSARAGGGRQGGTALLRGSALARDSASIDAPHGKEGGSAACACLLPLSSEHGTYKTVKARFWPRFSGESP